MATRENKLNEGVGFAEEEVSTKRRKWGKYASTTMNKINKMLY